MSSFENKKKLLFDCLSSAEKCIEGTSLEQKRFARDEPTPRNQLAIKKRFHGKESIFKRPQAPISKCLPSRRMPDFQKNPHKWKKYSLDDADISDRTNASAAFAFLAEIEKRKDAEEEQRAQNAMDTGNDSNDGKIVFRKQSSAREHRKPSFKQSVALRKEIEVNSAESEEKAILKGSKVVMPEYVIGQKKQKKSRNKPSAASMADTKHSDGTNKPQLQHLFEEEEEEDED